MGVNDSTKPVTCKKSVAIQWVPVRIWYVFWGLDPLKIVGVTSLDIVLRSEAFTCPTLTSAVPRNLTCSTQQVTLTVMEGNIPMFSYSFFPFCSQIIEIWHIWTDIKQFSFQDISTFYSPSFNHYYQLSPRPRFLGARQQIRGRDHRQKPRGHRSASDRWPRWGDHHAGLLPGRHSRNRAKRGCVAWFLLMAVVGVISIMYICIYIRIL